MAKDTYRGGCMCGAVRYEVRGPLRDVIACHCRECRKASSHFVAATAARPQDFKITQDDGLAWYSVAGQLNRGFCRRCGSTLFFDHGDDYPKGIAAGSLDDAPGLKLAVHIYVDEAGSYYTVGGDEVPQMDRDAWRRAGWSGLRWV